MNLTKLAVQRPTAIIMLVVLFLGLGVMGYMSLGADLFPEANTPIIAIRTTYIGASAEEIEKDITKPIEDAVSPISGIDTMRSTAGEGYGYTIVQFHMSTDTNTAVIDVQKAIESIADDLPKDASKPVIHKFDLNAQPILIISVSGASTYEELYNQADKVKRALEKLSGVGNVTLQGAYEKQLAITIDKTALEAYGVDISTVLGKLQMENMNIPAGQIKQDARDKTVRVMGEFEDINEVKDLRIPLPSGGTVRLAEFAQVELKYPDADTIVRLNEKASIGITVQKQSDANVVETANRVKKELDALRPTLIQGTKLIIASDATTFINGSLSETKRNLIEGIITTSIVLLFFLRSFRSSLIVLVSIPTSLVATFFVMYVFKFTFNIVSLMALAMCVGILVDDSIVVLENIHRHISLGKDPKQAAIDGRAEIGLAAIAITLCDVVVFAPMAFLTDMVGQFFKQFGLTVVFATLFSLFVSFTLTPMMASRMFKKGEKGGHNSSTEEKPKKVGRFTTFFEGTVKKSYKSFLIWTLNNRWKVLSLVVIAIILSVLLIPLNFIGAEFLPQFDQSRLLVNIDLSPGSTIKQTDDKVKIVEQHLKTLPEVEDFFTSINSTSASININLLERSKRKKGVSELSKEMRQWGKSLTGVSFSVTEPGIVGNTSIDSSKPVVLNITGSNSDVLKQVSKQVEDAVRSVPGVVDVDNSMRASDPEIRVKVDRLAASEYGISISSLSTALRTAIAGTKSGVYRKNGDEYDIVVSFNESQVKTPYDIGSIKISNPMGQQISLDQISHIYQSDSPQEILRLDRQKVVTIAANMQGRVLGDVNTDIKEKLKSIHLPYGYEIEFGGDQKNMTTSFDSLIKALIASILLVYMILVVLYESYLTPAIRMLSLPCGIVGALLALAITGKSLNLVSLIGFIMLDGLASKNGTLLIDYTNTLMKRGLPLREALVEAGMTRLRPIMMTSFTMIVGMLPLAISLGEGSEIKQSMAIALIGGLTTSTLLSPILLPVVYTMIDDLKNFLSRKRKQNIEYKVEV